ncbi:Dabb family protein [Flavimaricola marinus]|uniref:Stress responsive A/B Barrel Domain protein n=1 Tax=Flavimaricola marinus TaxID=1819565 RepID=A0A238LAG7_9RHOB|nr:Dabb family protein [Flavimaricola marinus]SMY06717.1 Stress responsive A/B Barrel Domain protein [Flavimaricola marinus]
MILHCVYGAIPNSADPDERRAVMDALAGLQGTIDGMLSFESGPNRDYEGLSKGYTWGFVARFRDRAALAAYDAHPEHKAAGARLVALCDGGVAGLMVFDLEVPG